MAAKCDVCGKTPGFGHNVSHSKHRTKRRWMPNTHRMRIVEGGRRRRINICTRCRRSQHKLRAVGI